MGAIFKCIYITLGGAVITFYTNPKYIWLCGGLGLLQYFFAMRYFEFEPRPACVVRLSFFRLLWRFVQLSVQGIDDKLEASAVSSHCGNVDMAVAHAIVAHHSQSKMIVGLENY